MPKHPAQGTVEYLLMIALVIIIVAWAVRYLIGVKGGARELGDSLSTAEGELNSKVSEEVSSNLNSD